MEARVLKKIKALRQERGLSLEKVSEGVGFKGAHGYWKIEKNQTPLTLAMLAKLEAFFGVPEGWFFE
ncbi:MAG: helix-turn-helix transcriptional regulator [bacterium]